MTDLQSTKKTCPKPGHNNHPILLACLDPKCSNNMPCCLTCIDQQQHPRHHLTSLHNLQHTIQQQYNKQPSPHLRSRLLKLFGQYQQKFMNVVKVMENQFMARVQSLEGDIARVFREVHEVLAVGGDGCGELLGRLVCGGGSEWGEVMGVVRRMGKYQFGGYSQTNVVLSYQLSCFKQKLTQLSTQLTSKFPSISTHITSLTFHSTHHQSTPTFHPHYHHSDLSIQDNICVVEKRKNTGNRTIALTSRPLDPINNSVKFRVVGNGDGIPAICVGVAVLGVVKGNNFGNCTGYKRGVYCIDQSSTSSWGSIQQSNEATYWNHDINTNNQTIGFQFGQGDIVEVMVDFEGQTIIFEVGDELFDMEIKGNYRDLYPYVSLSNSNSIVEIVQ